MELTSFFRAHYLRVSGSNWSRETSRCPFLFISSRKWIDQKDDLQTMQQQQQSSSWNIYDDDHYYLRDPAQTVLI
jgi:hypothetical protein